MSQRTRTFVGIAGAILGILGLLATVAFFAQPLHDDGIRPVQLPYSKVVHAGPEEVPEQGFAPPLFGYEPQPSKTREFVRSLPAQNITAAAPDLMERAADDKTQVLLYRALYEAYAAHHGGEQWKVGAQGIGDCVSWGWAHGLDIHLAVMWKLGETSEWRPAATESIYGGSRVEAEGRSSGGWGDGSYGGAAAKWVRDYGAIFRQDYGPEFPGIDLSIYSASRAKQWGNYGNGGQGDGGRLDAEAKKHPVRGVALVRNFSEAAAAIASGYPVPVCSGRGFSSRRDQQGFCSPSGSWSHCMCFVGVRHDRPGLLCLNSWGTTWVSGPKWPEDQPDGSFWVDANVATDMLNGSDSFAVSGYEGFPYRDLKHGDWVRTDLKSNPLVDKAIVRREIREQKWKSDQSLRGSRSASLSHTSKGW